MKSKALRLTLKILSNALLALAILLLAVSLYFRFTNRQLSLFGYSFSIVVTGSMDGRQHPDVLAGKRAAEKPIIKKYDFIITKKADIDDINAGDVVLFKTTDQKNLSLGIERILHKVDSVNEGENGVYLKTRGTANTDVDDENVYSILGRHVFTSSFIGWIYRFFLNPVNMIFLIVLGVAAYVVYRQIKSIKTAVAEGKNPQDLDGEPQVDKLNSDNTGGQSRSGESADSASLDSAEADGNADGQSRDDNNTGGE